MTLYKNRYRIESDARTFFGEINRDSVRLSALGRIVADEWQKRPLSDLMSTSMNSS